MERNEKKKLDGKTNMQIHIVEEHLRKIMSFVDYETALLATSVALGKYIEEHSEDAYDILERCNQVHGGTLISAGILKVDDMM